MRQCCGSMTFWYESGSADPCLTNGSGFGSGSCYFRHWPLRRHQKTNFFKAFYCWLLFEGTFTSFLKDKSKKSHKTVRRSQGFSYYFCLIDRRIRIRIQEAQKLWIRRIRISNTAAHTEGTYLPYPFCRTSLCTKVHLPLLPLPWGLQMMHFLKLLFDIVKYEHFVTVILRVTVRTDGTHLPYPS